MAEDVVRLLKAERAVTRWQAVAQLMNGRRGDLARYASCLADALQDEHPFVRWQVGMALAQCNRAECLGALWATLEQGSPLGQASATDAMLYLRKPDFKPLLKALTSPHALVRQSAAEVLARRRFRGVLPFLLERLSDESPWVRRAAVSALGYLRDRRAVEPLIERLADESVLVRRSAAYALGALRARQAGHALMAALLDPDAVVRRNASWALGRIAARAALPKLEMLLNDPALDGEVAEYAGQAISAIHKRSWRRWLFV